MSTVRIAVTSQTNQTIPVSTGKFRTRTAGAKRADTVAQTLISASHSQEAGTGLVLFGDVLFIFNELNRQAAGEF